MPKRRRVQNPEKLAAFSAQRARRTEENADGVAEYQKTQLAAREQLLRLREARLARDQGEEA